MATNALLGRQQAESTNHLKSIFEQSLAVLGEDKSVVMKTRFNVGARRDFLPLHIDPVSLQKRALDDAAKALAALWKVSDSGRSRMTARVISRHK
jgi:hypothetical protein